MYKTRNTGTGNGMLGVRKMRECYITGNVAKHSGKCCQTFQESNKDQSKLKFLTAEILKLTNLNTSLKDDYKSKLKIIESLTTLVHVSAQSLTTKNYT